MGLVLQAAKIKKQYGIRVILEFDNFQIYEGDKIGVVGMNGAGKSTLLGILCGEIQPDEGVVTRQCRAAHIRQLEEAESCLSGGENVKKRILRETGEEDTVIFADEPTANLDKDGIKWVTSKLEAAKTVLLISHDRELLDAVCSRIVEVVDGKLNFYTGNYSDYLLQSQKARERQEVEYTEYKRKKNQLTEAVHTYEQKVSRMHKSKKRDYSKTPSEARLYINSMAAKQKKVERAGKVLDIRLERLETVERPKDLPKLRIDFSLTNPPQSKNAITCNNLSFSYPGSPDRLILDDVGFVIPVNQKVAVTGKNGAGKTTLLRLIYEGHPCIAKAPKLKIGYLHQSLENLDPELTALENVLRDSVQDKGSVYSILAGLLFGGDGFNKKAGVLSGGERIRLSLAMLIASGCNALMLDEPTNYLDIHSIEAVQSTIQEYPGTVIVVSHDERFLREIASVELLVENGKVMTRDFIADKVDEVDTQARRPDKMLLELRRSRLVSDISSAPPEQKDILEREYAEVLKALSEFNTKH